jgi:hypothetical protein
MARSPYSRHDDIKARTELFAPRMLARGDVAERSLSPPRRWRLCCFPMSPANAHCRVHHPISALSSSSKKSISAGK